MNRFAGINIKNRSGLMGFRGVNLGIMMSGQALWWKLNCLRESGGQDCATISAAMARVRSVSTQWYLDCDCDGMGVSTSEEEEFHTESAHFGLEQLVKIESYIHIILQMDLYFW